MEQFAEWLLPASANAAEAFTQGIIGNIIITCVILNSIVKVSVSLFTASSVVKLSLERRRLFHRHA